MEKNTKNAAFFFKERKRTQEFCVLLKRTDAQPWIPVHPAHICKMVVITPFGLWEFTGMPFGLKNTSMSFQRLMDRVLQGLPFIFVYLDDILIASQDATTHRLHLQAVFHCLRLFGLVLNIRKCVLGASSVDFLRHHITAGGAQPLTSQTVAIDNDHGRSRERPNRAKMATKL